MSFKQDNVIDKNSDKKTSLKYNSSTPEFIKKRISLNTAYTNQSKSITPDKRRTSLQNNLTKNQNIDDELKLKANQPIRNAT